MTRDGFVPLDRFWHELPPDEMVRRARAFREELSRRRSVRDFSDRPVPREVIEQAVRAAGRAPSGANRQPWHFAVVSDAEVKARVRERAEAEERTFYEERAPEEWLEALEPLGTGPEKPFLEDAPYLIAVFARSYDVDEDGGRMKNYYVQESVGIATGMLVTALHRAGLATLTHTPSPMSFLNEVLERPDNERPFLLLVAGYPAGDAEVPDIGKKPLEEISSWFGPAPDGQASGTRDAGDALAVSAEKPRKRSVAFVVLRPGREGSGPELVAVLRPPDDEELPDAWGLPAATLRPGEGWEAAVRRAGREKLGVELDVGEVLGEGELEREAYTLRMRLYRAAIREGEPDVDQPVEGVTRYAAWSWSAPGRLAPSAARGSLCSRLCLRWLGRRPQ